MDSSNPTLAADLAKYDLIRMLRRESRRLCDRLDRDLEVRKGLTREAFRLARAEMKAQHNAAPQAPPGGTRTVSPATNSPATNH